MKQINTNVMTFVTEILDFTQNQAIWNQDALGKIHFSDSRLIALFYFYFFILSFQIYKYIYIYKTENLHFSRQ